MVRCAVRDPYADLAPVYDELAKDPAIGTFYREWQRSLRAAFTDDHQGGGSPSEDV